MALVQNQWGGDAGASLYNETLAGYAARENQYNANYANNIAGWERLYATQGSYGESERARVRQEGARNLALSQQSMVSRGLGNTTALDSAARGVNYDSQNQMLTLNDQLLQRQNQIAQQELGYMGQYQQGLAGLQGERLSWMGGVQQNTQAQNVQAELQQAQFNEARRAAAQNYVYQQDASKQGFNYQQQLAQQGFNNQVSYQNQFGYYAGGGVVPPSGTDVIPARLTPGEFVLSNDMIRALETGALDSNKLMNMIRQQRIGAGQPPVVQQFARGGMVRNAVPSGQLHTTSTFFNDQPIDRMYHPWRHGG